MFKNLFKRESAVKRSSLKADIKLQNDGIVVHPGDSDTGSEDSTMVSGVVRLTSDSSINVRSTRIAFVLYYRYKRFGKDTWEEGILHEHGETFVCGQKPDAIDVSYSKDGGIIGRRIDFAILVPKDTATFEWIPAGGMIWPQIRVSVEIDYLDWLPDELRALPVAPPVYVDDGTIVNNNHQIISERWSGGSVIPDDVTSMSEPIITCGSLSPGSTTSHQLSTWVKNFMISANPNPSEGPVKLRLHKRGVAAGIGEWNAYLWSDCFSVGSYVQPRLDFSDMAPTCNIFTIELHLIQTYSIIPIEEYKIGVYDPEEYQFPTDTFLLGSSGEKPQTNRPGYDAKALWRGIPVGRDAASPAYTRDGMSYSWEPGQLRLPVAKYARPSTCVGTKSPILLKHKFVLKVYFSVTGETVEGQQIPEGNGVGHLRMLIATLPQPLPSCTCVDEWVTLPGYDEANDDKGPPKVPLCACCYATDQFPESDFTKAFPPEQLEERERNHPLPTQSKSPVHHNGSGFGL